MSLFGGSAPSVASDQTPGHFSASTAGGANAGQGFEGNVSTNPWDYLLAIEGACLWASGVVRRFGQAGKQMAAFPFTVNVSGTGASSLADTDGRRPKAAKRDIAEMWLPLWERPLSVVEISALLSEGRATIGTRLAENGTDFARATAGLGVDRGIRAFHRVAFLMRNGQNFMAISLGRFEVKARRHVDLLREIDPWLARYRQACTDKTPARFTRALRRIDRAIFDYCRYGGDANGDPFFQAILMALGDAERGLASGEGFRADREKDVTRVPPLHGLSTEWIAAADDGSAEFEVALALAGIHDPHRSQPKIGPVRCNLEPVTFGKQRLDWARADLAVTWNSASLAQNLRPILARRLMDGKRANCKFLPIASRTGASLETIARFIAAQLDDDKIARLLWGMVLVSSDPWPQARASTPVDTTALLPRAYALLKLLFLPFRLELNGQRHKIGIEPAVLPLLASNRIAEACQTAMRRLRASGLRPMPHRVGGWRNRDEDWTPGDLASISPDRLAAALLIPISTDEARALCRIILRLDETRTQPA